MTIHRSHHPVAAPVRYRKPDPSPERLLSAAEEARADLDGVRAQILWKFSYGIK
jgi:hypothetical protein